MSQTEVMRLNPLGIGEGFELSNAHVKAKKKCLNPLGIGEGFELTKMVITIFIVSS